MGTFNAKDAKDAKGFEEVKGLVAELEMVEARPYAPDAPTPFKQELRGRLLQKHERPGLSWAEMGRLWRFAGTAVALLLLAVAVGLFWTAISDRGTAVGPAQDTIVVATRTAVPESNSGERMPTIASADNLAVQLGEYLRLTGFTLNQSRRLGTRTITLSDGTEIPQESEWNELRLTLNWQVLTPLPHDDFTLMFHLTDEAGKVVQAIHIPSRLRPWSTWQEGKQIADFHGLPIGDEVAAGHYYLWLTLYDSRTDEWLPVQAPEGQIVVKEGTAVQLADWQYHPDYSSTFAASDVIGWSNRPANVIIGDGIQLAGYDIAEEATGLRLTLQWQSPNGWPENTQLFVHLLNENGEMVWQTNTQASQSTKDNLLLEPELDGRYDIIIGLYDPSTGQRLPVTAGNERMVVDGGTAVWLTDWEFTAKPLCGEGFYDGNTFQIRPCGTVGNDDRILFALQKARPSANALVEIEVTVNYEPVSDKELFLKLHYAAPNWESFTGGGRMPIDGMSDYIPLNPAESSVTITFTGNPAEMAQIVGTDRPALVVQLAYFVEGANGRELKILDMQTYPNALDLSNPDEVRYEVIP
ncbi:MAG TPA: hypothetical protein PLD25_16400 [Chloroflexota bacterium]|nr:hypothetical protein [Chloroflexota bacterium]HUM70750.1 hypothetical protein [Chloroflexota bacterium]